MRQYSTKVEDKKCVNLKFSRRKRYDFLIVGLGLAGGLLAWRLWQRGANILVVDRGGSNASLVAAGLMSAVTGKRWSKTPGIESLLPEAKTTYAHLETELEIKLWYSHRLLRLYGSTPERELARRRVQTPDYQEFLGREQASGEAGFGLADPFGSRWILNTAQLQTQPLLTRLRDWLRQRDAYLQSPMDYHDLKPTPQGVAWQQVHAREVIFCEGWHVIHNPWFCWLPWQPSHGEILTLEGKTSLPPFPVNRGIWMLPQGEYQCRVGATYDWHSLHEMPTDKGVAHLQTAFQALFQHPPRVEVIAKTAGVRPNTLDHRPILGRHPHFPQLILYNGLGSKGSLYAPNCSQVLADHLCQDIPIPSPLSIERYLAHFPD